MREQLETMHISLPGVLPHVPRKPLIRVTYQAQATEVAIEGLYRMLDPGRPESVRIT